MKTLTPKRQHLKVSGLVLFMIAGFCSLALASSDAHGGVHNAWLTIDTWKVLNFGILAVAMFFIGKKPVVEFFSSRAKGIEDELTDLEARKADAEKKLAEYETKFKNLDEESKTIVADYIKQGEEAKKRIIAEAEAQADKLEDLAKKNIAQEFKAAKAALQQEIVEMAMDRAEEVIKKSIKAKDQDKLINEYLKKVEA